MKNHPKITRQYPDKQLTTAFLIAKEPSLCNHGKNSHKRFQPKTREIKLRGQAGARASSRGMSGLCCYDSTRGTPSRRRPSYRHATRGSTHYQDR